MDYLDGIDCPNTRSHGLETMSATAVSLHFTLRRSTTLFADPQVITVNAVAKSMPRIKTDGTSSIYQLSDETFKMMISHQVSKLRLRSMVRIDQRAVVADPLTAVNDYETLSVYTVIDRPPVGFALTSVEQLLAAHKVWLDNAAIGKLYGQES